MGTITSALGLGYDSRAIANEILEIARAKGQRLTIMQLVKLLYFAHGWNLAFRDKPLMSHKAQAWQYGPVYPHVYKAFPGAGSGALSGMINDKVSGQPIRANLTDEEREMLSWVVDTYGQLHAFDLSRRTHADDGPWKAAIERGGTYSEISDDDLRAYFKKFT